MVSGVGFAGPGTQSGVRGIRTVVPFVVVFGCPSFCFVWFRLDVLVVRFLFVVGVFSHCFMFCFWLSWCCLGVLFVFSFGFSIFSVWALVSMVCLRRFGCV